MGTKRGGKAGWPASSGGGGTIPTEVRSPLYIHPDNFHPAKNGIAQGAFNETIYFPSFGNTFRAVKFPFGVESRANSTFGLPFYVPVLGYMVARVYWTTDNADTIKEVDFTLGHSMRTKGQPLDYGIASVTKKETSGGANDISYTDFTFTSSGSFTVGDFVFIDLVRNIDIMPGDVWMLGIMYTIALELLP